MRVSQNKYILEKKFILEKKYIINYMLEKKQSNQSNASQRKIQIVDFLDIDTNKITFQKPKPNKYNGSQIGILYNGERMYVRYYGVTPFGTQNHYDKDGRFQGKTIQINCEDQYLVKARELDNFFINAFYENGWNINKNIPIQHIQGYDEHGQGGLWKRICKAPYKLKSNEREYLNYPSKMEFSFWYKDDEMPTILFNESGKKLDNDLVKFMKPYSKVKFVAAWFSLCRGTSGLTLKPKIVQIKFNNEQDIFKECLLSDSDSDDSDDSEFSHREKLDPEWMGSK